jgi:quercetin dioxygenase-like cupin family protein
MFVAACLVLGGVFAQAQSLPPNYKTTFENSDFIVMRVHYGAHEFVPMHDHSAYPTVYVYLNNSGEVDLKHDGPNGFTAHRPPTHTGAFRISPGMKERHSVTNLGDTPSIFLRVELKSIPADDLKAVFRGKAPAVPAIPGTQTEFQDAALKIERTQCAATAPCSVLVSGARSLLVSIGTTQVKTSEGDRTLASGDTMWLPAGKGGSVRLSAGAQVLRVVLQYP